jgi:hypothetical protein
MTTGERTQGRSLVFDSDRLYIGIRILFGVYLLRLWVRIIVLGAVGDGNMFHIVILYVKEDFGWAKSTIVSRCGMIRWGYVQVVHLAVILRSRSVSLSSTQESQGSPTESSFWESTNFNPNSKVGRPSGESSPETFLDFQSWLKPQFNFVRESRQRVQQRP